jgi:hypothetical protein
VARDAKLVVVGTSNLAHHARNVWHIACTSQIAAFFKAFLLPGSAAYRRFTMRNFATTKQSICLLVTVLAFASNARAESRTFCDEKCGDTQACKFNCCTITTTTMEGVPFPIITSVNCSSSICCAHPTSATIELEQLQHLQIPAAQVQGISGSVKSGLTAISGLDASTIVVKSDESTQTVTLIGTVKSESQRAQAIEAAKKGAHGRRVIDKLEISK